MSKLIKDKGETNPSIHEPSSLEGLGNPVAIAAVASVIPWGFIIKAVIVIGGTFYVINSFKKRFIKWDEVKSYPAANISVSQAMSKADIIHKAMLGIGNGFETVRENIAGLNYNGWARLYNAFGNRDDSIPGTDSMNLSEWFESQFDNDELSELRVLVPNTF